MDRILSQVVEARRRLAAILAGTLLLSGCAQFAPSAILEPPPKVRSAQPDEIETLPVPIESLPIIPSEPAHVHALPARVIPIGLDTVFRMAQDQNGEIVLAREKLQEAFAGQDLAAKAWIPNVYVGASYFRHEGGIQDFDGRLLRSSFGSFLTGMEIHGVLNLYEAAFQRVDAERKVWQQRGELSQLSSENLLDAASAYIDLLTALEAERVAADMEVRLQQLLDRAEKLAKVDPGIRVEVSRVRSELNAQKLISRRLREGAASAEAKIKYLLGLDPAIVLAPIDRALMPIHLVNVEVPVEQLIDRAWTQGPGVAELQGLLDLIERSAAQAGSSMANMMPIVEVNMGEGLFGAGPGSRMDWANRWDFCVRLKWDLKRHCTACEERRIVDSQRFQAHISYQNLRGKLALGVQEAREATLSNRERAAFGAEQLKYAEETYSQSQERLDLNVQGASPSEVLLAVRSLAGAHLTYLEAVRDLDKAQLRLFVLLGEAAFRHH